MTSPVSSTDKEVWTWKESDNDEGLYLYGKNIIHFNSSLTSKSDTQLLLEIKDLLIEIKELLKNG
jgi:hypothetical protein